jgi:hypothetical protein
MALRALRKRYGRAARKDPFTWEARWDNGQRSKSFRSRQAAETEVEYLLGRGYDAYVGRWYHNAPHIRDEVVRGSTNLELPFGKGWQETRR